MPLQEKKIYHRDTDATTQTRVWRQESRPTSAPAGSTKKRKTPGGGSSNKENIAVHDHERVGAPLDVCKRLIAKEKSSSSTSKERQPNVRMECPNPRLLGRICVGKNDSSPAIASFFGGVDVVGFGEREVVAGMIFCGGSS